MKSFHQQLLYMDTIPAALPPACLLSSDWSIIVAGDVKNDELHISTG